MATRLLFVDDEASLRATLPQILEQEGFKVTAAASVPEALEYINRETYDVLLTDLNIGNPGDGFTLVSAMRRTQPRAVTLILTGYPDFETALEAIRSQVDDYLVKPADIPTLVSNIKERLQHPRRMRRQPPKRVASVIREHGPDVVELWLEQVERKPSLRALPLSREERIDQMPELLAHLAAGLDGPNQELSPDALAIAVSHGRVRAAQGYTVPLLLAEAHILNKVLARVLEENLLVVELSTLVFDALKVGEHLNVLLEESIQAFQRAQKSEGAA
jgi:DNA-binding response OmpR family regulator